MKKNKEVIVFHRNKCDNNGLPVENIQIPAKAIHINNKKTKN